MKPENSSWYAVHLFVDNKEKEIHLWADDVQISPSGHLLFFIFSNNAPQSNVESNSHNLSNNLTVQKPTNNSDGSQPCSKIHFAFAPNLWKAFWLLDSNMLPYSLKKIEEAPPAFVKPIATHQNTSLTSPAHFRKNDESLPSRLNTSNSVSQGFKPFSANESKSNENQPFSAKSNSFSETPFHSQNEAVKSYNSTENNKTSLKNEKTSSQNIDAPDEQSVSIHLLTDEQRTLNYLAQHPYLGVNSLSATLDIEQDVLEKMLLQLCKERKIPISYLSLPSVQEELSTIMPEIMAQKPKNITEVMSIIDVKKSNQEVESEIETLQVQIWLMQDFVHKKHESNNENS